MIFGNVSIICGNSCSETTASWPSDTPSRYKTTENDKFLRALWTFFSLTLVRQRVIHAMIFLQRIWNGSLLNKNNFIDFKIYLSCIAEVHPLVLELFDWRWHVSRNVYTWHWLTQQKLRHWRLNQRFFLKWNQWKCSSNLFVSCRDTNPSRWPSMFSSRNSSE